MDFIQRIVGAEKYHTAHPSYIVGLAEVMMRFDSVNQICKVGKPCISESGQVVCIPKRYKCNNTDESRDRASIQAKDLKEILNTMALAGVAGLGITAAIGARNARIAEAESPYGERERYGGSKAQEQQETAFTEVIKTPASLLGTAIAGGLVAGTSSAVRDFTSRVTNDIMRTVDRNISRVSAKTEEAVSSTNEEPNSNVTAKPNSSTTEESKSNITEEPKNNTTEETENKATEEPKSSTTEEPENSTAEEPKSSTAEKPENSTDAPRKVRLRKSKSRTDAVNPQERSLKGVLFS